MWGVICMPLEINIIRILLFIIAIIFLIVYIKECWRVK